MLCHRLCNSILCVGEFQFSIMIWAPNLNIKHVSRFVLKNAETVEGTSNLGPEKRLESKLTQILEIALCGPDLLFIHAIPVVFAPDVEHEDTGNEEKGHYQNWNWANLPIRIRILTWLNICFGLNH